MKSSLIYTPQVAHRNNNRYCDKASGKAGLFTRKDNQGSGDSCGKLNTGVDNQDNDTGKNNGRKEGILRKLNTNNKLHVTVTGTQLQQELKAHNWEKRT